MGRSKSTYLHHRVYQSWILSIWPCRIKPKCIKSHTLYNIFSLQFSTAQYSTDMLTCQENCKGSKWITYLFWFFPFAFIVYPFSVILLFSPSTYFIIGEGGVILEICWYLLAHSVCVVIRVRKSIQIKNPN